MEGRECHDSNEGSHIKLPCDDSPDIDALPSGHEASFFDARPQGDRVQCEGFADTVRGSYLVRI